MNIYEQPTPRTDAEASDGWSGDALCVSADFARRLEQELETCRDAHMANCLAADTLRREIRELRHDMERGMANHNADLNVGLYVPPSTNAAPKAAEQRGPENNPLVIPAEAACVSVPKQPTEDMVASGVHAILCIEGEQAPTRVRVVYRAMLNARPISGPSK